MSKEFLAAPTNFKPEGHPVTPYMRAQQEWDNRIGATVVQAKNWRLAFFCSSLVCFALTGGMIAQSLQRKVIPVIVGIDTERGEPKVIGRVSEDGYQPKIQEVKYFISQFIGFVRSVPSDPVLIKQNWLKSYAFLRHDAANLLNDLTNKDENSPLKRIGQQTVIIKPISVVQVAGTNSYQARWEETIYDNNGLAKERYVMNGVFTVEMSPPTDEAALTQNPLGLFIENFQWSREL